MSYSYLRSQTEIKIRLEIQQQMRNEMTQMMESMMEKKMVEMEANVRAKIYQEQEDVRRIEAEKKAEMERMMVEMEATIRSKIYQEQEDVRRIEAEEKAKKAKERRAELAQARKIRQAEWKAELKQVEQAKEWKAELKQVEQAKEWSCPDDGNVYRWTFNGHKYLRSYNNEIWVNKNGSLGEWVGVYQPSTKSIDTSVPAPEFEE